MPGPWENVGYPVKAHPQRQTFVKICGITRLADARLAVGAGANALGFLFAPSPRRISPSRAAGITRHLHPAVTGIGVFVDSSADEILGIVEAAGLGGIQLHGSESPELARSLKTARPALMVFKAIRVTGRQDLARAFDYEVDGVFLDPKDPSRPLAPAEPIPHEWLEDLAGSRYIVSGGLTPGNVGALISRLRPWGVDVSGGVEKGPGQKDPRKVAEFVRAVRGSENAAGTEAAHEPA